MDRRNFLKTMSIAVSVVAVSPTFSKKAHANPDKFQQALMKITGGKTPTPSDKVQLKAPEIAENGAVVPIKVLVNLPVEQVKAIHVFAKDNPNPYVFSIYFTPQNGRAFISTRIKLAKTTVVHALAELNDGSFLEASQKVKVTIGGCG
ncbi:MAG: thiosulfate oxidation carrier protein SoxY [Aquificae bacterium]|nr:thiosulfate oxidation carrier protein SoxY [Aquificota bacterium]